MKNLKKLISVVLCVAMIAGVMVINVGAANYGDVDETKSYYSAVELLSALGILKGDDEGNFNPDSDIKRSEFAAVVCRALGQENAATSTKSKFDDVTSNHWAVGYIAWAAGKGIVNGYGDGNFGPDDNIKYQDAIKMLVSALGYSPLAETKGGYPFGYIALAGTYGVTNGLSVGAETLATRAVVAQLTANALDAPLMDTSYYTTTGEQRYVVYDGKKAADYEERTILSQYLDIIKVKANVAATFKTDPDLWNKNDDPQVALDISKVYNATDEEEYDEYLYDNNKNLRTYLEAYVGDTAASDYLAFDVIAYMFLNDNDDLELKAIIPDGKSVETLTVTKDIEKAKVVEDTSKATFTYWEDIDNDSKAKEVYIKDGATVYLNGESMGEIGDEDAADDAFNAAKNASSVRFVGAKGEDFDKIFITVYEYAQIDSINVEDQYISFDSGSVDLDKDIRDNDKFVYTIYKDGEEIGLEDLAEKDILSIVVPGGYEKVDTASYIDFYVSTESVTGTVTGAKSDKPNYTYYIDGTEYKTVDADDLNVGDEGIFYLTIDGKIYSSEASTKLSENYAFILKVGEKEGGFDEKAYQLRVLTKEGVAKTYDIASSVKVAIGSDSPKTYKTTATGDLAQEELFGEGGSDPYNVPAILAYDTEDNASDKAAMRLITFTESNDQITKISFAVDSNDSNVYNNKELSGEYKPLSNRLGNYIYKDTTKLFYTPISKNKDSEYGINVDDVALMSMASLEEDEPYTGYVYSVNSKREFGAGLLTTDLQFTGKGNALAVVVSHSTGLNAAGEIADKIKVFQGTTTTEYVINEDIDAIDGKDGSLTLADDTATGDIIQFVLNGAGEISQASLIYDQSKKALGKSAKDVNAASSKIKYYFGILVKPSKGGSGLEITKAYTDENEGTPVAFDYEKGCTMALVDENKLDTNSAITRISSVSGFKASSTEFNNKITAAKYLVVARVEDGDMVDAVEYKVKENTDGSTLNGSVEYKIS